MKGIKHSAVLIAAVALMTIVLGASPSVAQPRPHVYLLRGLINIFSLGMDGLAAKIEAHGIRTTVTNHLFWQSLADHAAAAYKAGNESPIIIIGHSLGANAAMEMARYLDRKAVPVALVVLFDETQSYAAPKNVHTLLNLTQHVHLRPGAGFHGSLLNVDVSADMNLNHFNIDKSDRLHAMALKYILAAVDAERHGTDHPATASGAAQHPDSAATPEKPAGGTTEATGSIRPVAASPAAH